MKIRFLTYISGENKDFTVGEEEEFTDDAAHRMIVRELAEPTNKKIYTDYLKKLSEEKLLQEENEQKATALLHAKELKEKREHHQAQIDEITHALGDGATYYKSYVALAEDLAKKESTKNENSNDSKKDDLSQESKGK
ncbi:hypothetical protein [Arcobacter roscoffensis]|uniref:Phage protein n=1 Tax=Arcobacter roscoffensis TaxID=2961520 RepID=A0ABY5E2N2_9BACT|nr:hypothetical protein [Arcobacter roscoffensis]UTJ05395.1 hypothetical protein NJU99_08950 [Arcobacter roscoffensis]